MTGQVRGRIAEARRPQNEYGRAPSWKLSQWLEGPALPSLVAAALIGTSLPQPGDASLELAFARALAQYGDSDAIAAQLRDSSLVDAIAKHVSTLGAALPSGVASTGGAPLPAGAGATAAAEKAASDAAALGGAAEVAALRADLAAAARRAAAAEAAQRAAEGALDASRREAAAAREVAMAAAGVSSPPSGGKGKRTARPAVAKEGAAPATPTKCHPHQG